MKNEARTTLSICVDKEVGKWLQIYAIHEERTVSAIVGEMIVRLKSQKTKAPQDRTQAPESNGQPEMELVCPRASCGKKFSKIPANKKYCSETCTNKASKERLKAKK